MAVHTRVATKQQPRLAHTFMSKGDLRHVDPVSGCEGNLIESQDIAIINHDAVFSCTANVFPAKVSQSVLVAVPDHQTHHLPSTSFLAFLVLYGSE